MPHYIGGLWMKLRGPAGVVAATYGPCVLRIEMDGTAVIIEEATDYPFSDTITFTIKPDRPIKFALWLRRPGWATNFDLTVTDGVVFEIAGWIVIEKLWRMNDRVTLKFAAAVELIPYANGEVGVRAGPLQYVLPSEPERRAIKDYAVVGFHDYDITPQDQVTADKAPRIDRVGWQIEINAQADPLHPWDNSPVRLKQGSLTLVPMGCTILRRAAFPLK
jgi:DUF1680 family protein